jgi:hypothetical protein
MESGSICRRLESELLRHQGLGSPAAAAVLSVQGTLLARWRSGMDIVDLIGVTELAFARGHPGVMMFVFLESLQRGSRCVLSGGIRLILLEGRMIAPHISTAPRRRAA